MPLTNASLTTNFQWSLSRTNTGYRVTKQGPESQSYSLVGLDTDIWNQVSTNSYTITSGSTQTIDLQDQSNLVYEDFAFSRVKTIVVQPVGSEVTLAPGAASGLQWFFGSASGSVVVPASGCFVFSLGAAASGTTVDSTHRYLKLTASGAGTSTVDVVILGSA